MGDRLHVIGPGDSPIYICKKKEVPELFTNEFFRIFEMWQYYYYGFGLPDRKHWTEQDPDIIKIILIMQAHFNNHFSESHVVIKYLEAIIKRLDNLMKVRR